MGVSYSKLFKLLIDKKMKKKDLMQAAGISPSSMAKLGKDEYVSLEVLAKICRALSVDIGDTRDRKRILWRWRESLPCRDGDRTWENLRRGGECTSYSCKQTLSSTRLCAY